MATDFPFSMEDICGIFGISKKSHCPFCGSKTGFRVTYEKNMVHCFSCNESGGMLDFYRKMKDIDGSVTNREIVKMIKSDLSLDDKDESYLERRKVEIKERAKKAEEYEHIAPIENRDAVMDVILSYLPLRERHYKDLISRGLSDAQIKQNRYCSTPTDYETCKKIVLKCEQMGLSLKGIPGFFDDGNGVKMAKQNSGFFVPYYDEKKRIQGMQIRYDKEVINELSKKYDKDFPKYMWMHTKNYPGGTTSPAYAHLACDWRMSALTEEYKPVIWDEEVYITEGGLKADIAHALSGKTFLAIPGVNAVSQLDGLLSYLKKIGVKTIYNAFDMDYLTNINVARAMDALNTKLLESNFKVKRLTWNDEWKGVDDYLQAQK